MTFLHGTYKAILSHDPCNTKSLLLVQMDYADATATF